MAFLDGLRLAWSHGLHDLLCFADSLLAKMCVWQQVNPTHTYVALIRSFQDVLAWEWHASSYFPCPLGRKQARRPVGQDGPRRNASIDCLGADDAGSHP